MKPQHWLTVKPRDPSPGWSWQLRPNPDVPLDELRQRIVRELAEIEKLKEPDHG